MTIDRQLLEQLKQTINVKQMSTRDQFGQPTYGNATSMAARVAYETDALRQADGTFVKTTHVIVTTSEIYATDAIWLPGASANDTSLGKKPIEILEAVDEFGNSDYWVTKV